tara:strand:- start:1280 stop:1744 length:465 start_codon:yes stop_codon:yes gene_type:complete
MTVKRLLLVGLMATLFGAGYMFGRTGGATLISQAKANPAELLQADRTYELRTYTAADGKLDNLLARFRDHTMRIFEKHGMTNHGYWLPQDEELRQNTLIYLISHDSRAAGEESWRNFGQDPEWQRVSEESQRDGRIIAGLERIWLDPTDFSLMK